eukprot:NODE_362_length_8790_cov_0.566678.p6 type:complete len:212 gc:universal NODE_362_length_8790_cov_0.566678:3673-4308(+)
MIFTLPSSAISSTQKLLTTTTCRIQGSQVICDGKTNNKLKQFIPQSFVETIKSICVIGYANKVACGTKKPLNLQVLNMTYNGLPMNHVTQVKLGSTYVCVLNYEPIKSTVPVVDLSDLPTTPSEPGAILGIYCTTIPENAQNQLPWIKIDVLDNSDQLWLYDFFICGRNPEEKDNTSKGYECVAVRGKDITTAKSQSTIPANEYLNVNIIP